LSYAKRLGVRSPELLRELVRTTRLLSSWEMQALFPNAMLLSERLFSFKKSIIACQGAA
jgi:hypothetical protein